MGLGRVEVSALRHFERFCREIGGRLVRKVDRVVCVTETDAVGTLDRYLHDFHNFVSEWKTVLDKPVEIAFENRLLGGWSEVASVTYDPETDKYSVYARLYSEYGVEPEYGEGVEGEVVTEETTIPHLDVTVEGEGEVDQNPATDEYVGVGEAWASIPRSRVRPDLAPELVEVFRKVLSLAERLAERASEELITPRA